MFGPIRAVVVDDKPQHLLAISAGLTAAGVSVTPYWYDRDELKLVDKLKPNVQKGSHPYLRAIFTDLNLEELTTTKLSEVLGPVISVITDLIETDCGPYVLVFWTVASHKIEDIRDELLQRLSELGIPVPIAVEQISKGKFLSSLPPTSGEEFLTALYSDIHARAPKIKEEIDRILLRNDMLHVLSEWETRAMTAAGQSVNSLTTVARFLQESVGDGENSLARVSARISEEAIGKKLASQDPGRGFDSAMIEILTDSFGQSVGRAEYSLPAHTRLSALIKNGGDLGAGAVPAKLNLIFHVDLSVSNVGAESQGIVLAADIEKDKALRGVEVWKDFFWQDGGNKVDRDAFVAEVEWMLIEVGADCDHAQSKPRSLRYLVAARVPAAKIPGFVRYEGKDSKRKGKLRNEALELLGPYYFDSSEHVLVVSLKRFVASQEVVGLAKHAKLFRLRRNVVDYLLRKYAAHSARPGIVAFR